MTTAEQRSASLNRLAWQPEASNAPENRAIGAMIQSLRWANVPDDVIYKAVLDAYECVQDRTPVRAPDDGPYYEPVMNGEECP